MKNLYLGFLGLLILFSGCETENNQTLLDIELKKEIQEIKSRHFFLPAMATKILHKHGLLPTFLWYWNWNCLKSEVPYTENKTVWLKNQLKTIKLSPEFSWEYSRYFFFIVDISLPIYFHQFFFLKINSERKIND